jgi:ribonuclease HIII
MLTWGGDRMKQKDVRDTKRLGEEQAEELVQKLEQRIESM